MYDSPGQESNFDRQVQDAFQHLRLSSTREEYTMQPGAVVAGPSQFIRAWTTFEANLLDSSALYRDLPRPVQEHLYLQLAKDAIANVTNTEQLLDSSVYLHTIEEIFAPSDSLKKELSAHIEPMLHQMLQSNNRNVAAYLLSSVSQQHKESKDFLTAIEKSFLHSLADIPIYFRWHRIEELAYTFDFVEQVERTIQFHYPDISSTHQFKETLFYANNSKVFIPLIEDLEQLSRIQELQQTGDDRFVTLNSSFASSVTTCLESPLFAGYGHILGQSVTCRQAIAQTLSAGFETVESSPVMVHKILQLIECPELLAEQDLIESVVHAMTKSIQNGALEQVPAWISLLPRDPEDISQLDPSVDAYVRTLQPVAEQLVVEKLADAIDEQTTKELECVLNHLCSPDFRLNSDFQRRVEQIVTHHFFTIDPNVYFPGSRLAINLLHRLPDKVRLQIVNQELVQSLALSRVDQLLGSIEEFHKRAHPPQGTASLPYDALVAASMCKDELDAFILAFDLELDDDHLQRMASIDVVDQRRNHARLKEMPRGSYLHHDEQYRSVKDLNPQAWTRCYEQALALSSEGKREEAILLATKLEDCCFSVANETRDLSVNRELYVKALLLRFRHVASEESRAELLGDLLGYVASHIKCHSEVCLEVLKEYAATLETLQKTEDLNICQELIASFGFKPEIRHYGLINETEAQLIAFHISKAFKSEHVMSFIGLTSESDVRW